MIILSIDLRSRREPFVDDYVLETLENVTRKDHHPERGEMVYTFGQPREHFPYCPIVIKDGGKFRLYYNSNPFINQSEEVRYPKTG